MSTVRVTTASGVALMRLDAHGGIAAAAPVPEAGDELVTPGLCDLQVNGAAGVDFSSPGLTAAALDHALGALLRHGVTCCLPTLISAPLPEMEARCRALAAAVAQGRLGGAMVPGIHLEGPFLSPLDGWRGCHPAAAMTAASVDAFARLHAAAEGRVRLVTLAPEVPGAIALIRHLAQRGIVAAIGHTAAGAAEIAAAVDAGATLSTHLGNGTPRHLDKYDNPVLHQLADDRLAASFLADGVHQPAAAVRVLLRAKGPGRAILASDATAAALAPPGDYALGPVRIRRGAEARAIDAATGRVAGGAVALDACLRNALAWSGWPLADVLGLATDNPRRLIGLPATPQPGAPAELVGWRAGAEGPEVAWTRLGAIEVASEERAD